MLHAAKRMDVNLAQLAGAEASPERARTEWGAIPCKNIYYNASAYGGKEEPLSPHDRARHSLRWVDGIADEHNTASSGHMTKLARIA